MRPKSGQSGPARAALLALLAMAALLAPACGDDASGRTAPSQAVATSALFQSWLYGDTVPALPATAAGGS